jgi:hypothetical protein
VPGGKCIALHKPGQRPDHISLSELSRDELLRQQAVRQGLLELSRTEVWRTPARCAEPAWELPNWLGGVAGGAPGWIEGGAVLPWAPAALQITLGRTLHCAGDPIQGAYHASQG